MDTSTSSKTATRSSRGGKSSGRSRSAQPAIPAQSIASASTFDTTKANKLRITALKKSISAANRVGKDLEKATASNIAWLNTLTAEQKQLEAA